MSNSSDPNDLNTKLVDLHIHSRHSMATSKHLDVESLYTSAKMKGLHILGTGDFTHPAWAAELNSKLEPAEPGLYKLKPTLHKPIDDLLPSTYANNDMRFIYTVEVSCIYSRGGRVRKVHVVIVASSQESAMQINQHLGKKWNLAADGRPILTVDCEELLKIILDLDPMALFIPAHIWTPWFGIFGSKSGFDSLDEAFGEHAQYIYALETGLDSDPIMNLQASDVGNRALISHSDAHSAAKLGREATLFDIPFDYHALYDAIKFNSERLVGTLEFFPGEGKYHFDGHRKCKVSLHPNKSAALNYQCPVCEQPVIRGVLNRIQKLTTSEKPTPDFRKAVEHLVPLTEILAEVNIVRSAGSARVLKTYDELTSMFGSEFHILRHLPLAKLEKAGHKDLAQALDSMRLGNAHVVEGYDGVYGKVSLLTSQDPQQKELFS